MKFHHELSYDAPPAEVFAMLGDPAFREKVGHAQDVVSIAVAVTPHGSGFDLVNTQVQRTGGLPPIARKFAGDTTDVVITESWSGPSEGSVDISTPGKPVMTKGTITLTPSGTGTTETIDLEIKVKVPLIGGKLESLAADNILAGYQVEGDVGTAWLKGER